MEERAGPPWRTNPAWGPPRGPGRSDTDWPNQRIPVPKAKALPAGQGRVRIVKRDAEGRWLPTTPRTTPRKGTKEKGTKEE